MQRPHACKRDEDVLAALAAWKKEKRDLRELDPTGDTMPEMFQMEAVKSLIPLSSKLRDYIDEHENELDTFELLTNAIESWGLRKKKAENRETTSMEIGSVGEPQIQQARYDDNWDSEKSSWWVQWQNPRSC